MKREFLQNLKVGEEPLPKEVIDTIMAENGRDINTAKADAVKPYADYQTIKEENERLKNQQGAELVDGKNAQQWKEAHDKLVTDHKNEVDGINFQHDLAAAITGAKGKNVKAITALLDVEALRGSEDQQKAINAALEALKKDNGYLFDEEKTPPPYARGTGVGNPPPEKIGSLADALREKFTTK